MPAGDIRRRSGLPEPGRPSLHEFPLAASQVIRTTSCAPGLWLIGEAYDRYQHVVAKLKTQVQQGQKCRGGGGGAWQDKCRITNRVQGCGCKGCGCTRYAVNAAAALLLCHRGSSCLAWPATPAPASLLGRLAVLATIVRNQLLRRGAQLHHINRLLHRPPRHRRQGHEGGHRQRVGQAHACVAAANGEQGSERSTQRCAARRRGPHAAAAAAAAAQP